MLGQNQPPIALTEKDLFEKIGRLAMHNDALIKQTVNLQQELLKSQNENITKPKDINSKTPSEK